MIELALMLAGPLSKFDGRAPGENYVTQASVHAIERCLIDTEGWPVPFVYKQADRPDVVALVYVNTYGDTRGKVVLRSSDAGVQVISHNGPKAVLTCAPKK